LWDFSDIFPRTALRRRRIAHEGANFIGVCGILLNLDVEIHHS